MRDEVTLTCFDLGKVMMLAYVGAFAFLMMRTKGQVLSLDVMKQ